MALKIPTLMYNQFFILFQTWWPKKQLSRRSSYSYEYKICYWPGVGNPTRFRMLGVGLLEVLCYVGHFKMLVFVGFLKCWVCLENVGKLLGLCWVVEKFWGNVCLKNAFFFQKCPTNSPTSSNISENPTIPNKWMSVGCWVVLKTQHNPTKMLGVG